MLERTRGIEPLAAAWKAAVLPLYEIRTLIYLLFIGGKGEIRTHGTLACSTVFKTVGIILSPTFPVMVLSPRIELGINAY